MQMKLFTIPVLLISVALTTSAQTKHITPSDDAVLTPYKIYFESAVTEQKQSDNSKSE